MHRVISEERTEKGLIAVKFVELLLSLTCACVHYYSYSEGDQTIAFIATGSFVGYIIILAGIFAGHLLRAPIHKRLDVLFSLVGAAMFIASGALILRIWKMPFRSKFRDLSILKGAVAFITGALFIFDFIFAFKVRKCWKRN